LDAKSLLAKRQTESKPEKQIIYLRGYQIKGTALSFGVNYLE